MKFSFTKDSLWGMDTLQTVTIMLLSTLLLILSCGCGALDIIQGIHNGRISGCGVVMKGVVEK